MKINKVIIIRICILVVILIVYMPVSITRFEGFPEQAEVVSITVEENFSGPVLLELNNPEEIEEFYTSVSKIRIRKALFKSVYPKSPDLYGINLWTNSEEVFEFWIDGNKVKAKRLGKNSKYVFVGEPFTVDPYLVDE